MATEDQGGGIFHPSGHGCNFLNQSVDLISPCDVWCDMSQADVVVDILCVISRSIIMCNIYVNYNRKPNKYSLFRWIRRTGNTCFVVIASLHCYMARAFSSWCKEPGRL